MLCFLVLLSFLPLILLASFDCLNICSITCIKAFKDYLQRKGANRYIYSLLSKRMSFTISVRYPKWLSGMLKSYFSDAFKYPVTNTIHLSCLYDLSYSSSCTSFIINFSSLMICWKQQSQRHEQAKSSFADTTPVTKLAYNYKNRYSWLA